MDYVGVIVPSIMFISIAVVAIFFIIAWQKSRNALIKSDLRGADLKNFLTQRKRSSNPYSTANVAIIAIGIGLALLIGSFVEGDMQEQITFGMVLLFPGIGLFLLYVYMLKHEKKNGEEDIEE